MKRLTLGVLLFLGSSFVFADGFRDVPWYASKAEAQKKLGKTDDMMNKLHYQTALAGMQFSVTLDFFDDQLIAGRYQRVGLHGDRMNHHREYLRLNELLTEKYGTPFRDDTGWTNDLLRNEDDAEGTAFGIGHVTYIAEWRTESTQITHRLSAPNYSIHHSISYQPLRLDTGNLDRSFKKTKTLEQL
ncbi:MAG: hypothetical protein AAF525_07400 [Pseudomonadota bacterium]